MTDLTTLVAKAAKFASYRTNTYDADPMVIGTPGTLTPAEATDLVAAHVAHYTGQRWLRAEPYGAITLHQGTRRIRLEPGLNNKPKLITKRQAEDLLIIDRANRARIRQTPRTCGLSISCGLHGVVPPAATEKLIERGYVATTGALDAPVRVSLAGTVALTWRYLKTENVPSGEWGDQIAENLVDVFSPEAADV